MVTMGEVMASCRFESYCEHKICNNTKVSDSNTASWTNMWIHFYDQNQGKISSTKVDGYTRRGEDFCLFPMWYQCRVPYNARYFKIEWTHERWGGGSTELYCKGYAILVFEYNGGK